MKTTVKTDIVEQVARQIDISKRLSGRVVDAVFETITDALVAGDEVRISGFGILRPSERAASQGHNPRTGEKITIAASRGVKLKIALALREALNPPVPEPAMRRRA